MYLGTSVYILETLWWESDSNPPKNKAPTDFVGGLIIPGGDEVFPRPADGGAVGHS